MVTTNALVDRVRALPTENWRPNPPAPLAAIENFEREHGFRIPEDHRALLICSDGGGLGVRSTLHLNSLQRMAALNSDEEIQEALPNLFSIGDDGGGCLYMYDRTGYLGHGAFAVYLVPLSSLDAVFSWYCAPTFAELVEGILAGRSYSSGRRLGRAT